LRSSSFDHLLMWKAPYGRSSALMARGSEENSRSAEKAWGQG